MKLTGWLNALVPPEGLRVPIVGAAAKAKLVKSPKHTTIRAILVSFFIYPFLCNNYTTQIAKSQGKKLTFTKFYINKGKNYLNSNKMK